MRDMTLREVCSAFEVSRRAVQGYEKARLISASGKNERGYLLYDADAQERIKNIKWFQRMGFTIKEISEIIDAPNSVLKASLEKQVKKLEKEKSNTEALIREIYGLIETL